MATAMKIEVRTVQGEVIGTCRTWRGASDKAREAVRGSLIDGEKSAMIMGTSKIRKTVTYSNGQTAEILLAERLTFQTDKGRSIAIDAAYLNYGETGFPEKGTLHPFPNLAGGDDETARAAASLASRASEGESKVLKELVTAAIADGMRVSVWDGEEWAVKRSARVPDVLDQLAHTDMETVRIWCGAARMGSISLVYGNSPDELISDHTDAPYIASLAKKANAALNR